MNLPLSLVDFGLKLGARFVPEEYGFDVDEVRQAIRSGMVGKIIEVDDGADGERVEIIVE